MNGPASRHADVMAGRLRMRRWAISSAGRLPPERQNADLVSEERSLLGRTSSDLSVLHEGSPVPLSHEGEPRCVFDVFVCRYAVVLGQRHHSKLFSAEQPRDLDSPQAAIDE